MNKDRELIRDRNTTLMNGYRRSNTINGKSLFMLSFYIMIMSMVLNGNEFLAGLRFVMIPLFFCMGTALIFMPKRMSMNTPIVFSIILCISAFISTIQSNIMSWVNILPLVIFNIFYILIVSSRYDENMLKKILKFYSVFVAILCFWMLIAYIFGVNTVNERISISYLGIRKDGNYLSAFLVPGYMIWLYSYLFGKKRLWKFIIAALIFVAIYLTGSRAAFLTMGIVTLLIISKLIFSRGITFKKITLTILLFITAFTGYYYLQSTVLFDRMITADSYTDNIRLQIWEYALEGFYNNPWLGSGIESGTYYAQLHLRWYTHSCFIDILTGQGIVGIALFAVIFIHYMRVKKVNFIFMTTLIISFFLPLNFVNGYESATFWVPMAICAIVSEYCKINNSINIIN